jgi:Wadjet protein JetA
MDQKIFFTEEQRHFFKPLTGKYREKVRACLKELYLRLNGPTADCKYHLKRSDVLEIFEHELTNAPELDDDGIDQGAMDDEKLPPYILASLLKDGWLEQYQDTIQMETAYRFTPSGRLFAQSFVELGRERYRASHRNTRNTRSSLNAYLEHRDPHDLIEAFSFSQEIFNDFNESLEEIAQMQQRQTRQIREQFDAMEISEDFFDYLQNRFTPDVSKMMGEESVSRYKTGILDAIDSIREIALNDPQTALNMEKGIRESYAMLIQGPNESVLMRLLDDIERRINNACDVKLPELRHALEVFTRRAALIIKQLSKIYSEYQAVHTVLKEFGHRTQAQQEAHLAHLSQGSAMAQLRLVSPGKIAVKRRSKPEAVDTSITEERPMSDEERLQSKIRDALSTAFAIENSTIVDKIYKAIRDDGQLRNTFLTIDDVDDLHTAMHLISIATNNHDLDVTFNIESTGRRVKNHYFEGDEFIVSMKRNEQ